MAAPQMRKDSKWWYGSCMVHGRRVAANLRIPVVGRRPTFQDAKRDAPQPERIERKASNKQSATSTRSSRRRASPSAS